MATGINFQQVRDPAFAAGRSLGWGAAHALAGHLYTSINPLTGGVFGVAFCAGQNAIHWAWDKFMPIHNPLTTISKWAIGYFGGMGLATGAANLVGLSLTFKAAVILHVSTLGLLTLGILSAAAVIVGVFGAMTAIKMYREGKGQGTAIEETLSDIFEPILAGLDSVGVTEQVINDSVTFVMGKIDDVAHFFDNPSMLLESYKVEAPNVEMEGEAF